MLNRTSALALACILSWSAGEIGRAQPIADKPDFRPGDSWVFSAKDFKNGSSSTWTRTIEAIESPDRIAVRWQTGQTAYYDSSLNPLLWGRGDWTRVLVKYPLRVGDEWRYSITFDDPRWGEIGAGKVTAYEAIEVPAGTFHCYRVEAESSYGPKWYIEYRVWTRWYCPEIKWLAKDVLMTRTRSLANPGLDNETTVTSVLVNFHSGQ